VSVARDGLGETQRGLLSRGEVFALGPLGKIRKLVVIPAQVAGEDGVAGQAIGRDVDLAGADDDELLELGGDRSGVEHGAKMGLHGGKDLRPVRHDAKHVGHVAALSECFVIESRDFRRHFAAIETRYPRHGGFLLESAYRILKQGVGARSEPFLTRIELSATLMKELLGKNTPQ
jgi:hypothetical protein